MIIKLEDYSDEYLYLKNKLKNKNIIENIVNNYVNDDDIFLNLDYNTLETFKKNNYASTYGELTKEGLKTIIKNLRLKDKIRFIDLGSGLGKVPLMMCYYFKANKCTGVELSIERHNKALDMYNKLPLKLQQKINYINDDLFNVNLSDYNFIFISNLCFPIDINEKLAEKLKECKRGTNIFCSKEIKAEHLNLVNVFTVKMTWSDNSTIYQYIYI
jgi:hypothetical protein